MQYPTNSKACRRLTKFAHRNRVSGVVRKRWSVESGGKGAKSSFVLMQASTSVELGTSRDSAQSTIRGMHPSKK